jgi:putative membrane protein
MDYGLTDLAFAVAHHLLIFSLAGILAFEISVIHLGMTGKEIIRVARIDAWYGILAGAILLVGFLRAIFAAKGWDYYSVNLFFWAKIAAFIGVGLLSIVPTMAIIRWRGALAPNLAFSPIKNDLRNVRRFLWAEATVFALIPVFAAAMARGYGSPTP